MQNPRRHRHEGCRRDRRAWPLHRRNQRAWLRHPWAAGPGRTTSQHADRSSRRGRPKWAGLTPPPAKFRMQFPRSTNRDKLKNRRISTIRTQTPTCAHGNCMRNWWLAAMAGHQGNVPSDISREGPTGAEGAGGPAGPGRGTGEIGRLGCGARGLRCPWAAGPGRTMNRSADRSSRARVAHGAARPLGRARRPENPRVHKQQPAPHGNT